MTYSARIYDAETKAGTFKAAGTLDGEIDFVMCPAGRRSRTVQLTLSEAELVGAMIAEAIADVRQNLK